MDWQVAWNVLRGTLHLVYHSEKRRAVAPAYSFLLDLIEYFLHGLGCGLETIDHFPISLYFDAPSSYARVEFERALVC